MYRLCKQGMNKYYAIEIEDLEDDIDNIEVFVTEGTPVILIDALEDLEDIGINEDDVILVTGNGDTIEGV